jgi:hypothetical protein
MRADITGHLNAGGEGLSAVVRDALAIVVERGKSGLPAASVAAPH